MRRRQRAKLCYNPRYRRAGAGCPEVASSYDQQPQREWKRLERHCTELAVTLLERHGVQTLDLIGCAGVVAQIEQQLNAPRGADWERWELNYRLGREPSLSGGSDHLLDVGGTPAAQE